MDGNFYSKYNMNEYLYDAGNSDEEIEEVSEMKTPFEMDKGVVCSKNGIISHIETLMSEECTGSEWNSLIN